MCEEAPSENPRASPSAGSACRTGLSTGVQQPRKKRAEDSALGIAGEQASGLPLRLALRAYAVEDDLVVLDGEAVGVGHVRRDVVLVGHVDVEHAAAHAALRMVMRLVEEIVAVGAVGNLHAQHLAPVRQHPKVAVHRRARDVGMALAHHLVHVGRGRMVMQRLHRLQDERSLNGVARRRALCSFRSHEHPVVRISNHTVD